MSYSQKLRDARWQRLRLKIMERDGWRCQAADCQSPENTMLHVHHKKYLPQREPWDYPLENLITYCEPCHERQHGEPEQDRLLVEGQFYRWRELRSVLGFQPRGYLTQNDQGTVRCGCFRLDYNPDAPDIVLPGTDEFIVRQALEFHAQQSFVPMFVKGSDFGWEYCGRYRAETITRNEVEITLHEQRAKRRDMAVSMVLFLEKET